MIGESQTIVKRSAVTLGANLYAKQGTVGSTDRDVTSPNATIMVQLNGIPLVIQLAVSACQAKVSCYCRTLSLSKTQNEHSSKLKAYLKLFIVHLQQYLYFFFKGSMCPERRERFSGAGRGLKEIALLLIVPLARSLEDLRKKY